MFHELEPQPALLFRGSLSSSAPTSGGGAAVNDPLGDAAPATEATEAAEAGVRSRGRQQRRRPKSPKLAGMVKVVLAALSITALLYTTVGAPLASSAFRGSWGWG